MASHRILLLQLVALSLGVIFFHQVEAVKETADNFFVSNGAKESDGGGLFLFDELRLPESVVYEFRAYCVRTTPFWFMVFRPLSETGRTYEVVGRTRVDPQEVPRTYTVTLPSVDRMIFARDGDRVGIWSEGDVNPLAYDLVFTAQTFRSAVQSGQSINVGDQIEFLDLPFPYSFSIAAEYDTDVESYLNSGTGTIIPPTVPPTLRATIPIRPPSEGTLEYTGVDLYRRQQVLETGKGLYLFDHIKFDQAGVIVKLYGYFIRKAPVWFTVWRPNFSENTVSYMLMNRVQVEPEIVPRAEEFVLDSSTYMFVQPEDRLGLMVELDTLALAYDFTTGGDNSPFITRFQDDNIPYPGYNATFTPIDLPYDIGLGAIYDTNPDPLVYGTAPTIVVTEKTSPTTPTSTTPPTTVIPVLPDGVLPENMVGRNNIRFTSRYLSSGASKTFLIKELRFPESGLVTSFWAYVANPGRMVFGVWRLIPGTDNNFILIGSKTFTSQVSGAFQEVPLDPSEQFVAQVGDYVGFTNDDEVSVVGYHFETIDLYYSENLFEAEVGDSSAFDQLPFPYNFALGAGYEPYSTTSSTTSSTIPSTLSTTPSTTPPTTTPTPATTTTTIPTPAPSTSSSTTTTEPTPASSTTTTTTTPSPPSPTPAPEEVEVSTTRPQTTETTVGTRTTDATETTTTPTTEASTPTTTPEGSKSKTTRNPVNAASSDGELTFLELITQPRFILGLFIWLIVLSLLFIILLIAVLCRCCQGRRTYYRKPERYHNSFTNPALGARPNSYGHFGSVRSDEGAPYMSPATGRPGSTPSPTGSGNSSNGNGVSVNRSPSDAGSVSYVGTISSSRPEKMTHI